MTRPTPHDLCLVITKDGLFHEGAYLGNVGGFLLFRSLCFASSPPGRRAIKEDDVQSLHVVMKETATTTELDYCKAIAAKFQ